MASRGDIDKYNIQPIIYNKWCTIEFEDSLGKSGAFTKLKSSDYFESGLYPVVDQGDKLISGYINDNSLLYFGELPVIIFGDHTRNVKYIDFEFAVGADGTKILTPIKQLDRKFFFYYLKTLNVPSLGYSRHYSILKEIEIPLPPLPEQERIAYKLDALFAQLDGIRAAMERIPTLLKNFRQQVLTQAVTGKLTEEWREGKDLENINAKEYKNENYLINDIPESWIHSIIEYIGKVKGGKRLPKGDELVDYNTGFPYIRARDLKEGTVLTENLMYLKAEIQLKIKNYIVKTNDVYITIVGAKIGDAGIIPKSMNNANLTENAAKITDFHKELNPFYLALWLRSPISQKNIQETIMSAAQGKLALTRIDKLPIYLPTLLEQQEIVRRVESLFSQADAIEQQYQSLKQKIDNLPQAILHKAFKGELVEQLPSDGDARDLLLQIEELKQSTKKKK